MKSIRNFYIALPQQHRVVLSAVSLLLLLLLIIPSEKATASRQTEQSSFEVGKRYQLTVPKSSADTVTTESEETTAPLTAAETLNWQTATVKKGDSLAKIFKRLGFSPRTTYQVSQAKGNDSKLLKKLNVGDKLRIGKNQQGELASLEYPLSKTETLFVNLIEGKYQSSKETKTVEIRENIAHGVIKSNFWNAGIEAGLDDGQIINLANIFGWDIDFALDIRKGDAFHVVYENKYVDGEYIGTGKILAAEFVNQDEAFQAIRFTDGDYYSPDGKSMKKAFLRAPVNFKYISSNFKPKRFHPIQKRWKAHRGTDYRAKKGTPVVASGNGRVIKASYNRFNGNYVFIQHGNNIVTKYLHFTKRAVKSGQRVKQGQVIGYVGATGLAEAPHLHYEFLLNGVHRNPRTVKLPDAQPIAKKYRQAFAQIAEQRLTELAGSRLALNSLKQSDNQAL
ncbi:family M23 zinc metallopeptidase with OapA domain protein [Thalassotalea insulae]|uniref:Family M23 zinc metallopeptidase with OapA domain protein n=1 Tax=Thalassotalea insulae TaxID=2056778 RepID=A0ABQ6GV03_9GAMM|nr:peptidoglycan DD-metalloendopeptidase family protein [Thalassotalea insulae]GLX77991.1 family M23 zinc metallopeptidase with OapA domain protein [Thalassotalea insulae]